MRRPTGMPRRAEPSGANRRRKMLKRIETMASFKQPFSEFIFATNTDGSGKAASFVRALDMRGKDLAEIANQRKDDAE